MTTRDAVWQPNDLQPTGIEHWREWLRDHLRGSVGDISRSFYSQPCVLSALWPVTYGASLINVDTTATRRALVEDADGKVRLIGPVAAAGAGEWFDTLAGSAGFGSIPFADVGATNYYVSLRYEFIPVRALALTEPAVSGAVPGVAFDVYQERIGNQGDPDSVVDNLDGTMRLVINGLVGSLWAGAPTRQVVCWKRDPVTAGVEAVVLTTCTEVGGNIVVDLAHTFGQGLTPSPIAADYGVCVLGPYVSTVDPTGDSRHVLLGVVNTGVVDTSVQTVQSTPEELDGRIDTVEAWRNGHVEGPSAKPGAYLGDNGSMAWNNITLNVVAGPEVQAIFPSDPLATALRFFNAKGYVLERLASAGVPWADYRYAPPGAGTYTICIDAVDETDSATPRMTATLTTYAGLYSAALAAGYLPLIEYAWNGAAIVGAPTIIPLRNLRGDRGLDTFGGDRMYLAPNIGDGSVALSGTTGPDSKGTLRLHALNLFDDDSNANTIAWEWIAETRDALPGFIAKVAAQANAAAQTTDTEYAGVQFGGDSDLMLVGRTVGGVRQLAGSYASNPATKEIMVLAEDGGGAQDQIPALSLKYPIMKAGDFGYLGANGKLDSRAIPLGNVGDGWRTYDNGTAAMYLGPWVYGTLATGGVQPSTSDPGNWWWLWTPFGGMPDPSQSLYIQLPHRYDDYLWDIDILGSNGNDGGDAVLTWSVVRVDDAGTETEWIVSKGGAGNDWLTNDIAEWRNPTSHGQQGADYPGGTGAAWVPATHTFEMELGYRWFLKVTPSVTIVWNGISLRHVVLHVRRTSP